LAANAVVVALVTITASALVANYQKRKAQRSARDAYNASLEDRLVMTQTANEASARLYGRVRNVDGVVFKGTWGANSENYTLVIAMAPHEIDGFETIFFNDVPCTLVSDGASMSGGVDGGVGYYVTNQPYGKQVAESATTTMTISGGSGTVTFPNPAVPGSAAVSMAPGAGEQEDGTFSKAITVAPDGLSGTVSVFGRDGVGQVTYQALYTRPKARLWKYKGAPGQTLYPLLSTRFPALMTTADKFAGLACIVVEFAYDTDVFPTGVPAVSAIMRGAKVLDTRTGVTAWTENPAMIARDWALYKYGGGMRTQDLNEASFIAAANACDVSTVFPTDTTPETRPLFQCGIVCKTDIKPDDHFGEMIEAMAGRWAFSGGQMKVVAGVYRAPVAAITDLWLSNNASVIVTKDPSKQDLVNHFKPVISNAAGYNGTDATASGVSYTATPLPSVRSSTFIAIDGEELTRQTTMLGVTRNVHAQNICSIQMREMRDGLMVQMTCNMRAYPLEVFDVVTLTLPVFGFNAKQFEVQAWRYTLQEGVQLVLKETSAAIYSVYTGIETPDLAPNTSLPLPWFVEQVTGVAVVSGTTTEDGWPTTRVVVSWDAITNEATRQSGTIEVNYAEAEGTAGAPVVWQEWKEQGSSTSATITGLKAGSAYIFRVRAVNSLGVAGKWSVQKVHVTAFPPPIDSPQIEPGAATEIIASEVATLTWTTPTGDPRGTLVKTLASVTVANPLLQATPLEITASTNSLVTGNPTFGQTPGYRIDIISTGGVVIATFLGAIKYVLPSQVLNDSIAIVWQYVLPAGQTVSVNFYMNGADSTAAPVNATNISLRVAKINR